MQFPSRDLTNQYISLSYQDVVQTYTQGTASYLLDGIGNALFFVPTSSIGQQVITADQPIVSSSYALTASFALNGGGGSSVSSSWASQSLSSSFATTAQQAAHSIISDTASLSLTTVFADTASFSFESTFSDTASLAFYSNYAGSASYALSSSAAITASYSATCSVFIFSNITQSVVNTVFATQSLYATQALFATQSTFSITASNLVGFNFINTGSLINILNTDTPIVQIITGSYSAAFFDYVALSGSNTRAGIVFGSWVNGLINYTEVSNVDVGDTSKVTMSLALSGNIVQLIANVSDTIPWLVKALARYL